MQRQRKQGHVHTLARLLEDRRLPLISRYDLMLLVRTLPHSATRSIWQVFHFHASMLEQRKAIEPDRDYRLCYRIRAVPDLPGEELVCVADRFCHISHLSAMQRWGLTDRLPAELILTRPDAASARRLTRQIMERQAPDLLPKLDKSDVGLKNIMHPSAVRGQPVRLHQSRRPFQNLALGGSHARIATIGQTFLDTLLQPRLCGGMAHVLDVWDEHARAHLPRIVAAVDACGSGVARCRAGYILEERLGIADSRIAAWKGDAQRGGGRKLDPSRPYAETFSAQWMISLNA